MASVHKRENSRYWYASFRVPGPDGKARLVQKCTKKTNRTEAFRAALELEEAAKKEAGAGEQASKEILAIVKQAADKATQGCLTPAIAREMVNQMLKVSGDSLPSFTVRGWMEEWLKGKMGSAKPATHSRYNYAINAFLKALGGKADKPLESLTLSDFRKFRDSAKGAGRASKTVNGYVKDVSSSLRAAVKEGLLNRNPADNLEPLPEEDSVSKEPFTILEVQKLITSAPSDDWRGVIMLGALGGLRLGDASRLLQKHVDLERRVIQFTPQKTSRKKKTVVVPLHPELQKFFRNRITVGSSDPCFASLVRVSISGSKGLSSTFGRMMDNAGVKREATRKVSKSSAGRTVYDRSFHSLRHTFNSWMANADVDRETRMRLTGHSTAEDNETYTHVEVEKLRRAVDVLPGVSGR